jgi:hypothetical protein
MKPRDQGRIASRRAVAERLRRFFSELTAQLAAGSAGIWERAQRKLIDKPASGQDATLSPGAQNAPTQGQFERPGESQKKA